MALKIEEARRARKRYRWGERGARAAGSNSTRPASAAPSRRSRVHHSPPALRVLKRRLDPRARARAGPIARLARTPAMTARSPSARAQLLGLALLTFVAGGAPAGAAGDVRAGTPASEDVARARRRRPAATITVEDFTPAVFERARRQGRIVLVDGAAAWCHWCHVMDETTYRDPEVVRLVGERFVFVRFDVDARPDLGDRYEATGWPATILISPGGDELGRYKGFLPADRMLSILRAAAAGGAAGGGHAAIEPPAPVDALGWIGGLLARTLDDAFDDDHAGWGRRKFPRPGNVLFELARAAHGDAAALERARRTLAAHRRLVDPVWGGIWKGNASVDWTGPHVEKQTIYQGENLEAFARGYAATSDDSLLAAARAIDGYLAAFMTAGGGGFYAAQDADVGAHDEKARFVDGVVYYGWGDVRRRAAGLPWIDTHVYARDNGLAIAGLAALYEVGHDPAVLGRARRAADRLLAGAVLQDGSVEHDVAAATGRFYLADAAALGLGLARLAHASGEAGYRDAARRIALGIDKNFADPRTGGLSDTTVDESAAGAFARREVPLDAAIWAARLDAAMARDLSDEGFRTRGLRALAAAATPRHVNELGPVVGDLLLALDELGALGW